MRGIIVATMALLAISCSRDPIAGKTVSDTKNSILLLRVDYLSTTFEGAQEIVVSSVNEIYDDIPIKVDDNAMGDVEIITLQYQPSNDSVFSGVSIWMGRGEILFPKSFLPPQNYSLLQSSIDKPDNSKFQVLFYDMSAPINYSSIWNAVSRLEIVSSYLKGNKKIGVILYRPSVGIGDPADWDWYVIMDKPFL